MHCRPSPAPPAFAAKEKEVEDLLTHDRRTGAGREARRQSGPADRRRRALDVSEINPSQRTISQIRAMDPRPGQLKGFDDYLGLARKGLDFTPRADAHSASSASSCNRSSSTTPARAASTTRG